MGHKARSLTQVNKKHKDSEKASKSLIKKEKKVLSKKNMKDCKELRILQRDQKKKLNIQQNNESDYNKIGNNDSAPILCSILPLTETSELLVFLSLLKKTDMDAEFRQLPMVDNFAKLNAECQIMKSKKFRKTFAFASCTNFRDRFDYLDLSRVSDWLLFLIPDDLDEIRSDYTKELITSLISQHLPAACFIVNTDKKLNMRAYEKELNKILSFDCTGNVFCVSQIADCQKLMRHLSVACTPSYGSTKKSDKGNKSIANRRSQMLTQYVNIDKDNELVIKGCLRGYGIDVQSSKFVHITDIGDLSIDEIKWMDAVSSNRMVLNGTHNSISIKNFKPNHESKINADLNGDVGKDGSDDEEDDEEDVDMSEEEASIGSDDEDSDEADSDASSADSMDLVEDDGRSCATTAQSGYSVAQIAKFRESREDSLYPNEIALSVNEKAVHKLRKYRGIKRFKTAVWPLDQNLPEEFDSIFQIKNYKHDRNRMFHKLNQLNRDDVDNFVKRGSYVELSLSGFTQEQKERLTKLIDSNRHIICNFLLPSEECLSVAHLNVRRLAGVDDESVAKIADLEPSNNPNHVELGEEALSHFNDANADNYPLEPAAEPIKSREMVMIQMGFRRFMGSPIYSDLPINADGMGNRGKSQFTYFMDINRTGVMASLYAPVMYGPCGVLQWRVRRVDLGYGELGDPYVAELVATGSLINIDPSKPIIKRVQLTGDIVKVNKKTVVVRYMFYNIADVEHFKRVPLHTNSGAKGEIKECRGTHGYMKCHFNKKISQKNVVIMPLYKRIFPKFPLNEIYRFYSDGPEKEEEQKIDMMDCLFE